MPSLCAARSRGTVGDRGGWEGLVRKYNGSLYAVARSFRLDQATIDDAVQTTWLRLVEHLETLREPEAVGAWLMTTLRRHISSILRSRRCCVVGLDGADLPDPDRSPEEKVTACDRDARLRAALGRLPVRDRQLLTLLMVSSMPTASSSWRSRSAASARPGPAASIGSATNWTRSAST